MYFSCGAAEIFGFSSGDGKSNCIFDFVHPDDAGGLRAKYNQLTSGLICGFSHQHRVCRQDGTYRWLESSYVSALDNPLIKGVAITSRDITERKQAESQLAQREEIFPARGRRGRRCDLRMGSDTRHRASLPAGCSRSWVSSPRTWLRWWMPGGSVSIPATSTPRPRQIGLALIEGRGWTTTYRIRDARGSYRSMLERGLIQRNPNGDPVRAIGCCVDVSEIKRLTDLLAEAQRTAKMGGWEYSYSTLELCWTEEMFNIYETSPAEFVVSWESMLAQCTPESRQRFHDAWERADSTDGRLDLELEIVTLQESSHLDPSDRAGREDRRPCGACFRIGRQDIQEQKVAQIALKNSTDWLKLSMGMVHMHAWRWDKLADKFDFAIVDRQRGAFANDVSQHEAAHAACAPEGPDGLEPAPSRTLFATTPTCRRKSGSRSKTAATVPTRPSLGRSTMRPALLKGSWG